MDDNLRKFTMEELINESNEFCHVDDEAHLIREKIQKRLPHKLNFYVSKSISPIGKDDIKLFQEAWKEWGSLVNVTIEESKEDDSDFIIQRASRKKARKFPNTIATSFYPSSHNMIIFLYPTYFELQEFAKYGVLLHEIGHCFGFRHEHIKLKTHLLKLNRLDSEDIIGVKQVTPYDPISIMNYIHIRSIISNPREKPSLSKLDRIGIKIYYCESEEELNVLENELLDYYK